MIPLRPLTALLATVLSGVCLAPAGAQAASLPDGRVYELVSPADKSGGIGGVFPNGAVVHETEQFGRPLQSSPDGTAVTYFGEDFYQPRFGNNDQYLSRRGSTGWSTLNLSPPGANGSRFRGFAPQLTTGVVDSEDSLTATAPAGYNDLYATGETSFTALSTVTPPNRTPATFGYAIPGERTGREPRFAGGNSGTETTQAFSHLLLAANDALTGATAFAPPAVDGGKDLNNLYEWIGGSLRLVNVLPDGTTEPQASFGTDYGDGYNNEYYSNLSHVISADGSKIFWTDENAGSANDHNLYVREDGLTTRLISAGGAFQTASADGSKVFFTKESHLYERNLAIESTVDLSTSGGVEGIVGASEDGTTIFFVSTSVLAAGAQEGQPNLYLSRERAPGERVLHLVATLAPQDNHVAGFYGVGATPFGVWYRTFAGRVAEVSPNGRYLAFVSESSLTGYDNTDAVKERRDDEVFVYDATAGSLACVSCNTDGSRPTTSTPLPAPVDGLYQERYLNDSGQVFFSTPDSVVPQDTNGLSDVYEYERGHVYLLSPGNASYEAVFADASETGNDVFFTTRQPLVPTDGDQIVDLYDARVAGQPETGAPPPCSSEICREAAAAPPSFQPPLSAGFSGPGNQSPPASTSPTHPKPARPTRKQLLSHALRLCRARHVRRARTRCERQARARYGAHAGRTVR